MRSLVEAVGALLADPADVVLAEAIFGTASVETIASRVAAHVLAVRGGAVAGCVLFTQSVGAVFVLGLSDGSEIVLKIHAPPSDRWRSVDGAELRAVYAAQEVLAQRGVPCARVVAPPAPFDGGYAAMMSVLPTPTRDDPHDPAVRTVLARETARIAMLGRELAMKDALPAARLPSTLFPAPHNALFDFTRPGGEWIDARARAARAVLDATEAPLVVMHSDISCANVLVSAGQVAAVFDMDSVCRIDEMRGLASIAVHYTYAGDPPWTWPSRDEARAFVADYAAARGRPLDDDEWRRLDAASIYALAYTARCEIGLDGAASIGPMGALLAEAPDAYLSRD